MNFPHELAASNPPHELLARAAAWLWPGLANHLWQATLFAALVFVAATLLRRAPARVRFALWLVAAAKFAAPSALVALFAAGLGLDFTLFAGARGEAGAGAPLVLKLAEPLGQEAQGPAVAAAGAGAAGAQGHAEILCALTVVWLAGCALLVFVWLRRRREFVRSVRAGQEVWAGREFEALARASARLGVGREALLVLTAGGTEPGVWRTRRPVVVLPRPIAEQLEDEELEAVLLHELAHVERRDNLFGNLQTALACAFWFNPVVWLVGRRLLAERERACDERVLEAGGTAAAYAAGILKVVRFCSGWRVAGVSGAASGSGLRRRIEMIMREEKGRGLTAAQRAVVCGLAAAALALTVGAGLLDRGGGAEARMLEALDDEAQEGGRVVAGGGRGSGGGVAVAGRRGQESGPAVREIEQAPEAAVLLEHAAGAPATINEARMRLVTREQLRRANDEGADADDEEKSPYFLTLPTVTVTNTSGKAIREVGVGFATGGRVNVVTGYAAAIRPGESQTIRSDWHRRNVVFPGNFGDVTARLVWVKFEDGTRWGARLNVPHPPEPPEPPRPQESAAPEASAAVVAGDAAGASEADDAQRLPVVVASGGAGVGVGLGRGVAVGGGGVSVGGGAGLGAREVYKPEPVYPPIARAARAEGKVGVRVTVDEGGNVVAATAVSGHPLLRAAAVEAARVAKFEPTVVEGKPVKVSGVMTYVFSLK